VNIRAVMNATKTIPIVMTGPGSDPVEAGFVESLARPGGNVTGLTILTGELGEKRLELLKEPVPKLARVAVLYDPALPGAVLEVKADQVILDFRLPIKKTIKTVVVWSLKVDEYTNW